MEVKLDLFVGKVRCKLQCDDYVADQWTEPVLLTQDVLDKVILGDESVKKVQFIPLDGKKYFTLLGVGKIRKLDLGFKK